MEISIYLWISVALALIVGHRGSGNHQRMQTALLSEELLRNYTENVASYIRPMAGLNNTDVVFIKWVPAAIMSFNDEEQSIQMRAFLTLAWKDDHLTWDPTDYNGIDHIVLPIEMIWSPNVVLSESVYYEYDSVIVYSDGCVFWDSSVITSTFCKVVVEAFPFDKQTCDLTFFSSEYGEIHFHPLSEDYNNVSNNLDELFTENGIWKIDDQPWQSCRSVRYSDTFESTVPGVHYTIRLRRQSVWFHLFTLFLPCFLLSFLSIFVFSLPVESGEKISFMMTILLSLFVYQGIVAAEGPPTGSPVFAYYIVFTIIEGLLAIVLTIHVIRFHFDSSYFVNFDEWLMRSVRKYTVASRRRRTSEEQQEMQPAGGANGETADADCQQSTDRGCRHTEGAAPMSRNIEKVNQRLQMKRRQKVNELEKGLVYIFVALKVIFLIVFTIFEVCHSILAIPSFDIGNCETTDEEATLRNSCLDQISS